MTTEARPTASHRKRAGRFMAVIIYPTRTYQPLRSSFASADEARAYAEKWIEANRGPKVEAGTC